MFTRRHYEFIARTIRALPPVEALRIAQHFADDFERASPAFQRAKFLKACVG
jgi:hypothetical protein